jgi:type IV secretory pathway VirB3-like protein
MEQDQHPLDEGAFDLAATRPPLTLGLPHTPAVSLIAAGMFGLMAYDTGDLINDLIFDAVLIGGIAMVWSAAKIMLRSDYHGWDIFVAWVQLDARCLDTNATGYDTAKAWETEKEAALVAAVVASGLTP